MNDARLPTAPPESGEVRCLGCGAWVVRPAGADYECPECGRFDRALWAAEHTRGEEAARRMSDAEIAAEFVAGGWPVPRGLMPDWRPPARTPGTRVCRRCRLELPLGEFNRTGSGRRRPECRWCRNRGRQEERV